MCAAVMDEPAGNPERVTVNVAVAAVMTFDESLVTASSMRTVPEAPPSVPPTGGTSLAVDRLDANTGLAGVGVPGFLSPHPTASAVSTRARCRRFIAQTPCFT